MISKLQLALGGTLFISPHCEDLVEELNTCHWSDTDPTKIVKAQKFHLIDALRYGIDLIPKFIANNPLPQTGDVGAQIQMEIRKYNMEARERAVKRRADENKSSSWRKQTNTTWRGGKIVTKR
jgi:hypothetical protein